MRQFWKNVFRMARLDKGTFFGAVFIIAIGIFIYVSMFDTLDNLKGQIDEFYESSCLADGFAQVAGMPGTELSGLKSIPGIKEVSGKMAADMRILAAGQDEIVTVHLLSWDQTDSINQISLSEEFSGGDELFLGARMMAEYGYEPGEPVTVLWQGESTVVSLKGTCHSPDYIYSIPPGGAMIPDGEVYDIACMERTRMERLTGWKDRVNELGFLLEPGYEWEDVQALVSEYLMPYGLVSISSRADQASFSMVESEVQELVSTGTVMPGLFLSVSVFMLFVVLKKIVDRGQSLIGTMKAFGLTDGELMGAYLLEGLVIGVCGAAAGAFFAVFLGKYMFQMYTDFFNLPDTSFRAGLRIRLAGLGIAAGAGTLAAFLGTREILNIVPAQAMRARAPGKTGRIRLPEALSGRLGIMGKMGCRAIVRNPVRGLLIVLAVAFPFAMSTVMFSYGHIADQMMLNQFEKIQVYDLQLSLDHQTSPLKAAHSGEELEEAESGEGILSTTAELIYESNSEFVALYGLNRGSELWKIMDNEGRYYEPPSDGLIINSRTAEELGVVAGELVEIHSHGLTRGTVMIPVSGIISESFGSSCYMELESFREVFQSEVPANTVLLKVKPGQKEALKRKLLDTSRVSWMTDTEKIRDSYSDMMASMSAMMGVFEVMGAVTGAVLISNISLINIRERAGEFGTLLILGGSRLEVVRMLLFENLIYFAAGIAAGIPGSYGLRYLMEHILISDSYTVSMAVTPAAWLLSLLVCLGIMAAAGAAQLRFIDRISLTEVIKERE